MARLSWYLRPSKIARRRGLFYVVKAYVSNYGPPCFGGLPPLLHRLGWPDPVSTLIGVGGTHPGSRKLGSGWTLLARARRFCPGLCRALIGSEGVMGEL